MTAIPEEAGDTRVGDAIATIGSNIPEMGRGVRELAEIMPDEHRADDLVDAARKLCRSFGNFLEKIHPERQEKRGSILNSFLFYASTANNIITENALIPVFSDNSFGGQSCR